MRKRKARVVGSDRWGKLYRFGLYEDMDVLQQEIILNEMLKARLGRRINNFASN